LWKEVARFYVELALVASSGRLKVAKQWDL